MSYTVYMMNYNFVTHATCPLKLTTYKYNELQVFVATQKLNCKANCKTFISRIVDIILIIKRGINF